MSFYSEIQVASNSRRFVNKIWCLDNSRSTESKTGNQLLPNGCFNIGIVVGNGLQVHFSNKKYIIKQGVYLCSQVTHKTTVDIESSTKIIFIQLHAWTFSFFPRYDLTEFLNSIVRLKPDTLPPVFSEYFTCDDTKQIMRITDRICKELNLENPKETLAETICGKIQAENATVATIVNDIGCSIRKVQMNFKKSTGLTVKQYDKIMAFRKSIDQIENSQKKNNFAILAIDNGYFDQAHYIRTFKEIVQLTPKEFEPKSFLLSYKDNPDI